MGRRPGIISNIIIFNGFEWETSEETIKNEYVKFGMIENINYGYSNDNNNKTLWIANQSMFNYTGTLGFTFDKDGKLFSGYFGLDNGSLKSKSSEYCNSVFSDIKEQIVADYDDLQEISLDKLLGLGNNENKQDCFACKDEKGSTIILSLIFDQSYPLICVYFYSPSTDPIDPQEILGSEFE